MEYDGIVPLISGDGRFRLQSARHPLLVGKKKAHAGTAQVVANTIVLDGIQRALILSGPNAGGKTVVLKTVGLLCLMAQSGLPITAAEGSELPCFGSVFADIGDEQSLEQDLSTFSSHVSQIAEILRSADKDSLVLLDELGSGTEPGEGAGLGAAVLESLIERGSVTVVTTHHNALKLFGSQTNGAVNAAMEFDPETLKPTYRLIPGRPGRSYGLDMASRLGIPDQVIERARSRIGRDDVRLEQLLEQVEADSRVIASERQVVEQELSAVRKERKEAEDALRAAHDEARDVKTRARTETQQVMAALRQKLRDLSRTARLEQAEAKRASVEVEALGRKLETENRAERRTIPADIPDLHAGDRVRIARIDKTGIVLGTNRNLVELEVGGKKIKVAASDVLSIEAQPVKRMSITTSGWGSELSEDESTDRLNIIGLRVSEGLAEVERFLDRATLHHITVVTVIHGIGTGALRTAVTDFLKNHPLIASIRTGEPAEGGAGVSIAELKK
jgi:DNA mismatch repair protein MutS2